MNRMFSWLSLAVLLPLAPSYVRAQTFTPDERRNVVGYWSQSGRQTVSLPPDTKTKGVFQVRLPADASLWFWRYQQVLNGVGKPPPTMDVKGTTGDAAGWEKWVTAKLDSDRWRAQTDADRLNLALDPNWKPQGKPDAPMLPGLPPDSLVQQVGNPPNFAVAVTPKFYTVTFANDDTYSYQTHVAIRPRYAYYRFDAGTDVIGQHLKDLPDAELDALFTSAGFSPTEQRVAKFVSRLEGGFEAINTYDTGYVSVGFLQFITAVDGHGSLSAVMKQEKTDSPTVYHHDFRDYGVEVDANGVLCVVDPDSGTELTGADAVQKVIADKRLTAVFQRAGKHSNEFRVAQIKVAKSTYWPLDDTFPIQLNPADPTSVVTVRVGDVVKSEAGMATLFDRKVNRGSVLPFPDVVKAVMLKHKVKSVEGVAPYEREIVSALKYRTDFLAEPSLSQPTGKPDPKHNPVKVEPTGAEVVPPKEDLP